MIEEYLRALETELSWMEVPRPVETLFLGGGTPTHLLPAQLARLHRELKDVFDPAGILNPGRMYREL